MDYSPYEVIRIQDEIVFILFTPKFVKTQRTDKVSRKVRKGGRVVERNRTYDCGGQDTSAPSKTSSSIGGVRPIKSSWEISHILVLLSSRLSSCFINFSLRLKSDCKFLTDTENPSSKKPPIVIDKVTYFVDGVTGRG